MIKNHEVASAIMSLMLDYSAEIDHSIREVQERCSDEEFKAYRRAAGKVMGEVFLAVMQPLYREHPDLKPEGLD